MPFTGHSTPEIKFKICQEPSKMYQNRLFGVCVPVKAVNIFVGFWQIFQKLGHASHPHSPYILFAKSAQRSEAKFVIFKQNNISQDQEGN
jgi:hypothetical protein